MHSLFLDVGLIMKEVLCVLCTFGFFLTQSDHTQKHTAHSAAYPRHTLCRDWLTTGYYQSWLRFCGLTHSFTHSQTSCEKRRGYIILSWALPDYQTYHLENIKTITRKSSKLSSISTLPVHRRWVPVDWNHILRLKVLLVSQMRKPNWIKRLGWWCWYKW